MQSCSKPGFQPPSTPPSIKQSPLSFIFLRSYFSHLAYPTASLGYSTMALKSPFIHLPGFTVPPNSFCDKRNFADLRRQRKTEPDAISQLSKIFAKFWDSLPSPLPLLHPGEGLVRPIKRTSPLSGVSWERRTPGRAPTDTRGREFARR